MLFRSCRRFVTLLGVWLLVMGSAAAQIVYGVGDPIGAGQSLPNGLFTVNTASGAATNTGCTLSFNSRAIGLSPIDGLVYYIEQQKTSPDLNSINPLTCANATARATTLPVNIYRATFCPDGRLYASGNTAQFFEINAATGATIRTLNFTGITTGGNNDGSGDFTCASNGDLYILTLSTTNGNNAIFALYRASSAAVQTTANNGSVAATRIGALGGANATMSGLSEIAAGRAGCAAAPAPCLLANSTTNIYAINSLTGASTLVGAHGVADFMFDLGRSFPVDVAIAKTSTPTAVLQAQTITYTLDVDNAGPGVAASVTVTDPFSAAAFGTVSWTCTPLQAGTATLVTTACSAASGTGSINNTVSLSLGGAVRYSITALLTTTFVGTVTNVGQATVSSLITDTVPSNNTSATVTNNVTPAALLTITKTNGVNTVTAGGTTAYTVTVANMGPADAPGSVFLDPAASGLNCTTVTFSATPAASITVLPSPMTLTALQSTGITLTAFPARSSATFVVTCGIAATGQ